ncbi:response regulator [bacterium]|nr:response regulator [bacterium]
MTPSLQNISLKGKRILVVDDDSVILNTIAIMLRNSGMLPIAATGGEEALVQLHEASPDIILLDYMMPGMNGVDVYKKIRQDDTYALYRNTPVIMLTAKTENDEEQKELLQMGMSAYLLKPFGYKELVNIISNVLTLHESRLENLRLHAQVSEIKNYLQSVLDGITDFISVQDASFNIRNYNKSTADVFFTEEYPASKGFEHTVEGVKCYERYFGRESACEHCPALTTVEFSQAYASEISNGGRYFQISTFPVLNESKRTEYFIEIIKDITERKDLEQQLVESVKLASVGTLAAGVAHEINNPLSIILGFAQTMLNETAPDHRLHKDLRIIEQEATRCAKVVKDLLTFARPGRMEKSESNIVELMQTSIGLLRHFIKKNEIAITENYAIEVPALWIDPKKMQQVLINVLLNAIESMPKGGALGVLINYDAAAEKVILQISDTGCGIPEDKISKIFDPFFTTKTNKGTGLGLSICRSIIKEHLGTVSVKSGVDEGTTFYIQLPAKGLK